mmetsp:Transcript_27789/g.45169  ORF Transcript_27789/g.45169 Transcript_27789/m.45169 type:complete len:349 (+) Transcript_27789:128-1174(+)
MDHPANQEEDPEVDYGEDDDNFAEQQEEVVPDEDAHAIEDEKGTLDHQVQLDNHAPDGDDADELKPIHEHEDALEARSADEEHHLSQSAEQQDINQQADDHVESLYDQDQEQGQNDNGNEELDPSQEGQEQLLNDQDEMVNEQDDPPHEQDDEQVQNESAMQDVEVQNNQGDSTVEDAVEGETIAEKVASSQRGRSSDSGSRPNGAGGAIANRPSLRGAVEAGQGQGPTTRMRQPDWPTRYFIIKSFNHDDVAISIERGIWATQARNESKLNEAFSVCFAWLSCAIIARASNLSIRRTCSGRLFGWNHEFSYWSSIQVLLWALAFSSGIASAIRVHSICTACTPPIYC